MKESESPWLVHGTLVPRDDGKMSVHAFGVRCRCVSVNQEEGTVTFKQDATPRLRFTIPVFGPGEHNKTEMLSIKPGDEVWLEMTRFALPPVGAN